MAGNEQALTSLIVIQSLVAQQGGDRMDACPSRTAAFTIQELLTLWTVNMDHSHRCPACNRAFESVFDYPTVRVLGFERLPIPEAVDEMSPAAAERRLARDREAPLRPGDYRRGGINMTPEIERACNTKQLQDYFTYLATLVGSEVVPEKLAPPFTVDPYFRRAYPVPESGIYLSLDASESEEAREQRVEIAVYCEGPNFGSAGGPTLQHLGAVGILRYEGLFVEKFREPEGHKE
jgi:hypothetical protein